MRRRLVSGFVWTAVLAIGAAGCDKADTTTVPTTPSPVSIQETFSGTLTVNGAVTFPFIATQAGLVTGTVKSLAPDATMAVGLAIGTFSGTTCQVVLANDAAGVNSTITGVVNAQGTLCARVFDVGRLTGPTTFSVEVVHY